MSGILCPRTIYSFSLSVQLLVSCHCGQTDSKVGMGQPQNRATWGQESRWAHPLQTAQLYVCFFNNEHFVHFGCVCGGGGRCVLRREKDQMKEETNKMQTQKYKEMSFKSRTKYYTICAVNFGRVHGGSCLNFSNVLS